MPFVLGSSVTLAWLLPDEASEDAETLAARLETDVATVPAVWPLEICNALLMAQRRGRIPGSDIERLAAALADLPIEVDRSVSELSIAALASLARRLKLTAYDAAYIDLAKRRSLALATLDARLRSACKKEGIAVLP
ncbi:MAG: type II toxin-antitoxin system VapC family toxin [Burkholderiales bacterium]